MDKAAGEFLILAFSALTSDKASDKADLLSRAGAFRCLYSVLRCKMIGQLYSVNFLYFFERKLNVIKVSNFRKNCHAQTEHINY